MKYLFSDKTRLLDLLSWAGILAVSFGVTASLFAAPPPVEVTRQYFEFGLDRILLVIVFFTALFSLKGLWGKGLVFLFTFVLFSIPLLYKWQTSDYYSSLGGLLPLRDANAYYQGAQNIIYGATLEDTAAYRPLFPSFLAAIMQFVKGNLQSVLVILVGLNALGVYFAAREVQQIFKSSFASALYLFLGYMFYRRYGGTLLTENMGFLLGNLALVFLVRGSTLQNIKYVLYGLFLLTTGLNFRAGAYLILPMLAVWLGYAFYGKMGFWKPFLLGFLTIVLGMGANWALAKFVNSPSTTTFSNYSYTLYGLVVGNKGWEQAIVDHPEAGPSEIYRLSFQLIRENPALFAQGVAGAYADYFVPTRGAFSFLLLKHDRNAIMNYVLWALSFAALAFAILKRSEMKYSLLLASFAGILLSVGLVPPADSTMMRVYAATIPLSIYIVITGAALPGYFLRKPTEQEEQGSMSLTLPVSISAGILIASFFLPIWIKSTGSRPETAAPVFCDAGETSATLVVADGSSIHLTKAGNSTFVPSLESARLAGKLLHPEQQLTDAEKEMVLGLEAGTTITVARLVISDAEDRPSSVGKFLITQGIPKPGLYTLCLEEQSFAYFYTLPSGGYEIESIPAVPAKTSSLLRVGQFLIFGLAVAAILIHTFEVASLPARKRPLAAANLLLITAGLALVLHMAGIMPLAWERSTLDSNKSQHREGFLYTYVTGNDQISDTKYRDHPTALYEDGVLMFHPHESQSLIIDIGKGRYILREKVLFFSTSDNSDPKTNGREYTLEYPARVRTRFQIAGFVALLAGLLLHFLYFKPMLPNPANHKTN